MEKGLPAYKVAEQFGFGKAQIQNFCKRKSEVLDAMKEMFHWKQRDLVMQLWTKILVYLQVV